MAIVNFQGYKVDKLDFVNSMESGTRFKLDTKFNYQVQYAVGKTRAKSTIDIMVHDKEAPDRFYIRAVVEGFFSYDPNEKKEIVHTETFKALYPYIKALITTITANCGIQPAVIIPNIDIDNQEIYRIGNQNN